MTWLGLPEVSEERSAFPAGWPSSWIWVVLCVHSWPRSAVSLLGQQQWVLWRYPVSQPSPRLPAEPAQTNVVLDFWYYSLIKLQHMCYGSSQFWLRTMKSWVISITFHPQCLLKIGSGGRTLLYPCLPECKSVLLDLCNNTVVQFPPFLVYLKWLRYCSLALHVFQCPVNCHSFPVPFDIHDELIDSAIVHCLSLWKGLYKGDDPPSSSVLFCISQENTRTLFVILMLWDFIEFITTDHSHVISYQVFPTSGASHLKDESAGPGSVTQSYLRLC